MRVTPDDYFCYHFVLGNIDVTTTPARKQFFRNQKLLLPNFAKKSRSVHHFLWIWSLGVRRELQKNWAIFPWKAAGLKWGQAWLPAFPRSSSSISWFSFACAPQLVGGERIFRVNEKQHGKAKKTRPRKSNDQTLPSGSRESFTWIILKNHSLFGLGLPGQIFFWIFAMSTSCDLRETSKVCFCCFWSSFLRSFAPTGYSKLVPGNDYFFGIPTDGVFPKMVGFPNNHGFSY